MNPYAPESEDRVLTGTDLFGRERLLEKYKPSGKKAAKERDMILGYFATKLDWKIGRVLGKVGHLKDLRDLYYIKSVCDGYEREGEGPWGKAFHGMLKAR
jgi:hypothetical protein